MSTAGNSSERKQFNNENHKKIVLSDKLSVLSCNWGKGVFAYYLSIWLCKKPCFVFMSSAHSF